MVSSDSRGDRPVGIFGGGDEITVESITPFGKPVVAGRIALNPTSDSAPACTCASKIARMLVFELGLTNLLYSREN